MKHAISILPAALSAAAFLLAAAPPPDQNRIASVTDGDTFRLETGERIRIAGIDAPETQPGQAKCAAEIVLGKRASDQARQLLQGQDVELVRVGRSYYRTVARVVLNGRDVAATLVATGAARWWPRYNPKPDWCAGEPTRPDAATRRRTRSR